MYVLRELLIDSLLIIHYRAKSLNRSLFNLEGIRTEHDDSQLILFATYREMTAAASLLFTRSLTHSLLPCRQRRLF